MNHTISITDGTGETTTLFVKDIKRFKYKAEGIGDIMRVRLTIVLKNDDEHLRFVIDDQGKAMELVKELNAAMDCSAMKRVT